LVTFFRRARVVVPPVVGHLPDVDQRVRLCADVLSHVRRHRQLSSRATEEGGQLFGTITAELIQVTKAIGPYTSDERSRYRYRSNPAAAQRAIEEQSQGGLLYLGEWHTHAEDIPNASGLDDDAMQLLLARSQLNSNALMMLIVGRVETVAGVALFTVTPERVYQWNLELSA
jgi:integrative and conjugative element protein (TIGR02256 family)